MLTAPSIPISNNPKIHENVIVDVMMTHYIVHWVGQWLNEEDLDNCRDLITNYEDNLSLDNRRTYLEKGRV